MKNAARRTRFFTESVIREMTRFAQRYGAINLAQGFPDFPAPTEVKEAAQRAIATDVNQYAITWGAKSLRYAIAWKMARFQGMTVDPDREVTVTCGATEAMMAAMLAVVDPGEEVVVFEPFYENYGPDATVSGARPRYVQLRPPTWEFNEEELKAAFSSRTKAVIVNTPHNPTGKVFTRSMLRVIADLCVDYDVLAVTDEIYEHILYDGREHVSLATLNGMLERTVTISGCSKTYSVTGWRVGYAVAAPQWTDAIKKVHDFLTVGAPAPLQEAAALALHLPDEFYVKLRYEYAERREVMLNVLREAGFPYYPPEGAYYVMSEIGPLGAQDDVEFANWLVREIGVATVPGSSFYHKPILGRGFIRFAFPKTLSTLKAAGERLFSVRNRKQVEVATHS